MKQHQHGGGGGGGGGGGNGPSAAPNASGGIAGGQGPLGGSTNSDQPPSHLMRSSSRDCWSQPPSHHAMHVAGHLGSRVNDDTSSQTDHEDEQDELPKKPLHLLQLNSSSVHRYSPHDAHSFHHKNGPGPQLVYRAQHSPPLHRYHLGAQQHELMTSSISAWHESELHGALQHSQQQQHQRMPGVPPPPGSGNHLTYSGGSAYMMASPEMTSPYQSSWFPHAASSEQVHHLSTLLS